MRESASRRNCDEVRGNQRNKLKLRGGNKLGIAPLWARAETGIVVRPIPLTKLLVTIRKNNGE